jgi:thymidine kinase
MNSTARHSVGGVILAGWSYVKGGLFVLGDAGGSVLSCEAGAGKSTSLLQASHNYRERGMQTYLMTAKMDTRAGKGKIASRIGIEENSDTFSPQEDLFEKIKNKLKKEDISCIFLDEAQFLTKDQVWALARAVDDLAVPIMCYGLRVDFMGELFPGSAALLALADEMREIRTICHCGKKATMVVRLDSTGKAMTAGDQVQIGGNETYLSLCRKHYREAVQDNTISELPM